MIDRALIAARREHRLVAALEEIHAFRPLRAPVVVAGPPLPITDDAVAAWVAAHPFLRGHLAPHIARCLAYLDQFKAHPP